MTALVAARRDVTVLIPAFNRFDLLQPVLEGFARQTARDAFTLIVVDDCSAQPIAELARPLGLPPVFRVIRRERNGGRGAALNTGLQAIEDGIVIVCDSDIVPHHEMVADHVRFHRNSHDGTATCLGALEWGMPVDLFGHMMGARSNPRLKQPRRVLGWTEGYTDNWSCRRALLRDHDLLFDERYHAWGYEDLDLGLRLQRLGATNQLVDTARGYHLKAPTPESLMTNFASGVPNLLCLAAKFPDESVLQDWLRFRVSDPVALECGQDLFRIAWNAIRQFFEADAGLFGRNHIADQIAAEFADCIFRLGTAAGLQTHASNMRLPPTDDREFVLGAARLIALLTHLENEYGYSRRARTLLSQCVSRVDERWREAWNGRVDFYRCALPVSSAGKMRRLLSRLLAR